MTQDRRQLPIAWAVPLWRLELTERTESTMREERERPERLLEEERASAGGYRRSWTPSRVRDTGRGSSAGDGVCLRR